MPIHKYNCNYCHTFKTVHFKIFSAVTDTVECPNCGRAMSKIIQIPNVHYRGSGFSKTDIKKPYDPFDKDDLDKGMERTVK